MSREYVRAILQPIRLALVAVVAFAFAVAATGCSGAGGGGNTGTTSNPTPAITSLAPASAAAGAAAQTLTISGSSFLASSTVTYNGAAHAATYASSSLLTIALSAADQATAGSYAVVITNPAPGGGSSNASTFTVTNPLPRVTSLSPASATAGAAAQTLTIGGSNFVSTSTVTLNGIAHAATYVGSSQLTIALTAGDQAVGGSYAVVVTNPAPGGGASSAVNFAVNNPAPILSFISPATTSAGAAALTMTVTGSGFVSGSTVQWNGSSRSTIYMSSTQLTAAINAPDLATGENAAVTVVNASPGGGTSAASTFVVSNPIPSISSLSPAVTNAGGSAFALTVNGTNFLPASTVQWNGSTLTTTYVSSNQLTAAVLASYVAATGTATVTVVNSGPGGGSPTAAFVIDGAIPGSASYVSPSGSNSNPGTMSQPWLTMQHCASTVTSGGTCVVRAGSYHETVTPNSGITITPYYTEQVTMDGADAVTGWVNYQGSIYAASATLSSGDTNQIFVGNQMMTEARWPNGNDLFHVNWATLGTGTVDGKVVDPNLPAGNWTGARILLWSGTDPWDPQTGVVTASSTGQVGYTTDGASYPPYIQAVPGGYYYLFGTLAALDAPNEWFYNSTTGALYFWAPGGVNPSTLAVTAKQRQYCVDLSNASNVTVEGINLFACTINTSSTSTNDTINAINAQYLSHFYILADATGYPSSYWYAHINDSGIILNGTGDTLENSTLAWSAGNGVAMYGSNNVVKNNVIDYVDYIGDYAGGITMTGNNQTISNNTIHHTGRFSLYATSVDTSDTTPTNDEIDYNNFYESMMLSRDGGEIYASYLSASGTQIDHNWLHGAQSLVTGAADTYPLSGVYLDLASHGWLVDQNVLWDNAYGNVDLNDDGTSTPLDNNILNNSIPDAGAGAYIGFPMVPNCGTATVANNLILVAPNLDYGQLSAPPCSYTNNGSTAPGATQMTSSVQVGCTLAGCFSNPPPAISGTSVAASVASDPSNIAVASGQTATFAVIANGTGTLSYQWMRNGVSLAGATAASYTTAATSSADNGATFTVLVSNLLGNATSAAATLTVQ